MIGQLHESLVGHVENVTNLSRKAQLEAYDGCVLLRKVFDDSASKYHAVITPSVVDEAPLGGGGGGGGGTLVMLHFASCGQYCMSQG